MLTHPATRPALAWAAVLLGGLLAAASLWLEGRPGRLPADAVALVGEQPIARAQWLRAVQAVEADRGRALSGAERAAVLQRLVDEELLYQHALASGLARDDPGLRKTLIAGLIDATTAGGLADEAAARELFARDPAYFAAQPRLQVLVIERRDAPGGDDSEIRAALGAGTVPAGWRRLPLPDDPLPLPQLAQHLGGSPVEALRRAVAGSVVGPLVTGTLTRYILLRGRYADAPRYEDVAEAVRSEWSRREAEAALTRLLQELRDQIPVQHADAP
ncbi:MAG TPA: hypothetical protein VFV11_00365 [Solimonas sp.]|nr:hypothetical protein [Solimonas sp.]